MRAAGTPLALKPAPLLTHEAAPLTPRDGPHWLRAHGPKGCCANLCPRIRLFVTHAYPRPPEVATHAQSCLLKALRGIRLPVIHAHPRPHGVGCACTVTATQDLPRYSAARDTRTPQTPRGGLHMYNHGHPRPSGASRLPVIHVHPRPSGVGCACTITATHDPPGYSAARDARTSQTLRGGLCMHNHGHTTSGCPVRDHPTPLGA